MQKRSGSRPAQPHAPSQPSPALPTHGGDPPQTLEQALLRDTWRLRPGLRYGLLLAAGFLAASFALWLSIPEKKKEQAIDFLTDRIVETDGRERARAEQLSVAQMKARSVELQTTAGSIEIEFFPEAAPNHVRSFLRLAESGFYNGTRFHRVNRRFTVQGGDPNTRSDDRSTWGVGGATGTLRAEFNEIPHRRGIVSMARSTHQHSASSQFFICVSDAPFLDGKYTVFGRVVRGMDVVDVIASGAADDHYQPYDPVAITNAIVREK